MLLLLPPSESKNTIRRGGPVDLDALSFPSLGPMRRAVASALIEASASADAVARLGVSEGLADVVRRNVELLDAPSAPAERVYAGVLYDALALSDLDASSRRRARAWIVVISALWGAVRMGDRIPAYRLNMHGRLPGLPSLGEAWREPLAEALPPAAKRGLVVDCRSSDYAAVWRPRGSLAERTVVVKVFETRGGIRRAASHNAKYTRGLVAREIVVEGIDPRRPEDLGASLSRRFDLELRPPARPSSHWELHVADPASA